MSVSAAVSDSAVVKIAFVPSAEAPWKTTGLVPLPQLPLHEAAGAETSVVVPVSRFRT